MSRKIAFFFFSFFAAIPVFADIKNLNYRSLDLGASAVFQGSGNSLGYVLRYQPSYALRENWSVGLGVDLSSQKLENNQSVTLMSYTAHLRNKIDEEWTLQFSAGSQTWSCAGCETRTVAGPTVYYALNEARVPFLQNIWVAYLPVFHDQIVHQVQVGAGFQF